MKNFIGSVAFLMLLFVSTSGMAQQPKVTSSNASDLTVIINKKDREQPKCNKSCCTNKQVPRDKRHPQAQGQQGQKGNHGHHGKTKCEQKNANKGKKHNGKKEHHHKEERQQRH